MECIGLGPDRDGRSDAVAFIHLGRPQCRAAAQVSVETARWMGSTCWWTGCRKAAPRSADATGAAPRWLATKAANARTFANNPACKGQTTGVARDVCPPQKFKPLIHALFKNEKGAAFREVCGDYHDIVEALAELERRPGHDSSRGDHCRQLATELLEELITMLKEDRT